MEVCVDERRVQVWGSRAGRVVLATVAMMALGPLSAAVAGQTGSTDDRPLEGQVVLITGSTDGLGREVALRVAGLGAHVIAHGRNEARGAEVVEQIRGGGGSADFYRADLASLEETRELARAILRDHERLDVLVNNAGIWAGGDGARQLSSDGLELRFQVNYLSGFALTHGLLPLLLRSAPSRIMELHRRRCTGHPRGARPGATWSVT
jgi:NAD(P)-dependent dehydrogenase (short-subunit alcohol dehydrogenase family)